MELSLIGVEGAFSISMFQDSVSVAMAIRSSTEEWDGTSIRIVPCSHVFVSRSDCILAIRTSLAKLGPVDLRFVAIQLSLLDLRIPIRS